MNAQSLRALVDDLLKIEEEFGVQNGLEQLSRELAQLMQSPQEQNFQLQYAGTLDRLSDTVHQMAAQFTPARAAAAKEIGADKFFINDLPEEIKKLTASNSLTPAVVATQLKNAVDERQQYLTTIAELRDRFERLGIRAATVESGKAEIGVLIPRPLFHNHLDEFAKELSGLNNIMRIFSELATGTVQPVDVNEVSTSDPTLFLGMDKETIKLVGGLVQWALDVLKKIVDLKRVREQASKIKVYTEAEMAHLFDDKAKQIVDAAVKEKVEEILAQSHAKARKHELDGGLQWALETIFAKVERGMTVELRFLPPAPIENPTKEDLRTSATFDSLKEIASQLSFPPPTEAPILNLPPPEPPPPPKPKAAKP